MAEHCFSRPFLYYDQETGRIHATGQCQILVEQEPHDGLGVLYVAADPAIDYIEGGAITPRPAMPVTLVGMVLKGVPAGASVTIEGVAYPADGTDIELSFSLPGIYPVTVSLFPYLDAAFEVTA